MWCSLGWEKATERAKQKAAIAVFAAAAAGTTAVVIDAVSATTAVTSTSIDVAADDVTAVQAKRRFGRLIIASPKRRHTHSSSRTIIKSIDFTISSAFVPFVSSEATPFLARLGHIYVTLGLYL